MEPSALLPGICQTDQLYLDLNSSMVSLTSIVAIEEVAYHIIALTIQPSLNYNGAILYRVNTFQQNEHAEEIFIFHGAQ